MSRAALSSNQEGNTRKYCGEITVKAVWSHVQKTLKGSTGNWITFVLWIISILLDPFICYVPSIYDEKMLLKINSSLLISIWVLYWSLLIYRICISFCENERKLKIFNQAESVALLLSNVLLYSLILIPKMEIRSPVFSAVLGIFLAVSLVRIIGIYRMFSEEVTRSASSKLAEGPIIKIVFNLLLFLYGGHLFGGLWYLFAVWKKLACWKRVCLKYDTICHYDYANNRFNVSEGNKLLNDNCFANKPEDSYELGIFKDAFASQIVEETTELWKKLLYCFRWGIQNISGFGTNLQVSTYAWENIFVILIAIYGVGTFTFFIGNMQNLIKSAIDERRKKEDRAIKQQLQQWFSFGKISENLQNCIKEYHRYNGQQSRGVDVKNLCRNLPKDVGNNLKHELCLELKKKVERFRRFSDASLLHLCYCLKPVVYDKHTRIVREGDPINEMLFVLRGTLWNFSSAASSTNDRRKAILKDGDFWGEGLVNWVQGESSSLLSKILISLHLKKKKKKLISHTTIEALTKVEAFVLRIDDLKKLFNEKAKILQSRFRERKKRGLRMKSLTGPEIVV